KRLDGSEVSGTIDDDGIGGIDKAPREQGEALLGRSKHQHSLAGGTKTLGDGIPKYWLALGVPVAPHRVRVPLQHVLDRLLKSSRRTAVDRRFPCRKGQKPCVGRVTDRVPQRRIARAERRRRDLSSPGEGRSRRFGRRADERAASDVAAQQTTRLKLP